MLRYRYAVCHTPCYSYSLRSGSYLCPSPHFIHYVLRSATITPRSHLCRCFISWLPTCKHAKPTHSGKHIPFRKPPLQCSLGSITASLCPSFISVGLSPPAANNFACLACLPQRRVCHGFCPTTQSLDGNQKHTPNPCILSSCQAPFHGFLATTGAGARSHRRSFLPLVSLMARYAPTPHCGQVCRRALASF